jgi:A/G-specific adenine glycosylase
LFFFCCVIIRLEKGNKKMQNKLYETEKIQQLLLSWYDKHKRDLPFRKTKQAYYIWVSEIMLQQTRVEAVLPFYVRFIKELPTIKHLAEVEDDKLMKLWQGLGYYTRARMLKKAAQIIVNEQNGVMPNTKTELQKLPGIGAYTAGAIASIAFEEKVPAIDGNVLRVISRVKGIKEDITKKETNQTIEQIVNELLPENRVGDFNQALMEVGATVCLPNGQPICEKCPFQTLCWAYRNNATSTIPNKPKKQARKIEKRTVILLEYNHAFAVVKRPQKGLLAGLFEFLNVEGHLSDKQLEVLLKDYGIKVLQMKAIAPSKHIFTHIEWHMKNYYVSVKENKNKDILFVTKDELKQSYSIPNAYKKMLEYVETL